MKLEFIFTVVLTLILWFKTDAFVEYVRLFGLSKIFKVDTFDKEFESNFELTYHSYLRMKHNNFFTRLITCPICLACWAILPILFIFGVGQYSLYVVVILSIYYLFTKLMS